MSTVPVNNTNTDDTSICSYAKGLFIDKEKTCKYTTLDLKSKTYAFVSCGGKNVPIIVNKYVEPLIESGQAFKIKGANFIVVTTQDGLSLGMIEVTEPEQIMVIPEEEIIVTDPLTRGPLKMEIIRNCMLTGTGRVIDISKIPIRGAGSIYFGFIKFQIDDKQFVGTFNKGLNNVKNIEKDDIVHFIASIYPERLDRTKFKMFDISFEIIDYYAESPNSKNQEKITFNSYEELYI